MGLKKVFTAETVRSRNKTTLYVVVAETPDEARKLIEEYLTVGEQIEFVDEISLGNSRVVTSLSDESCMWDD